MGQSVSVDLNRAKILFTYNGITEELSYSDKSPLQKSFWTVADKSSIIPFGAADGDNILEPNEVFTILVYPKTSIPSMQKFSVSVTPESELPLVVALGVPPEIMSQRIVELYD